MDEEPDVERSGTPLDTIPVSVRASRSARGRARRLAAVPGMKRARGGGVRIGVSPMLPLAAAAVSGVVAGAAGVEITRGCVLAGAGVALVAALGQRHVRTRVIAAAVLVAIFCLGGWRASVRPPARAVFAEGIVEACIGDGRREETAFTSRVESTIGPAILTLPLPRAGAPPPVGTRVRVRVRSDEARSSEFVALVGERGWLEVGGCGAFESAIGERRADLDRRIGQTLPRAEAGLARALLLGRRDGVDPDDEAAFRQTGSVHVLVVAGLHLAMAAAAGAWVARAVLVRVSWRALRLAGVAVPSALAGAAIAAGYALLAGGGVSTRRALVALAVGAVAGAARGRAEAWNALAIAGFVLALADPAGIGEPACVLGFLAVAGILAAGPGPSRHDGPAVAWWRRTLEVLGRGARTAVSAGLVTGPALAWLSGRVPVTGVLANVAAVPLAGAALAPLLAAALLPGAASRAAIAAAWPSLALLRAVAQAAAAFPFASVHAFLPAPAALAASASVLAVMLLRGRARVAAMACAIAIPVGVRAAMPYRAPASLEVSFLDVGQGDCEVVRFASGEVMVVDGGPPGAGKRVIVPFLRSRHVHRIDVLVATHAHPDHTGGLAEIAEAFPVSEIWFAGPFGEDPALARALRRVIDDGGALRFPEGTRRMGSARVDVLAPEVEARGERCTERRRRNDRSIVLRVADSSMTTLLAGDAERAEELQFADRTFPVDVVKVPHHGSATSSDARLVAASSPRVAVIPAGRSNRFEFPSPAVRERWRVSGATIFVVGETGTLTLARRGESLAVFLEEALPAALPRSPDRVP